MVGVGHEQQVKGFSMREDHIEKLESSYPNGFVFLYLDSEGSMRLSGSNMHKSDILTAYYHLALAMSCLVKS